jgi:hypothetical protein
MSRRIPVDRVVRLVVQTGPGIRAWSVAKLRGREDLGVVRPVYQPG